MFDRNMEYEIDMGYEGESTDESEEEEVLQLQKAFLEGKLKPGLNIEGREYVNNEELLTLKLNREFLSLPWEERLDLKSKSAPAPPELAETLEKEKERILARSGKSQNLVVNDFERESMFHRQAQAAVLEGISQLRELGVLTKRPDDYFAQMAKTDGHMQKVRASLLSKQGAIQRAEKVRDIRKMRKVNKELQKQARVQKEKEKSEFLNQVKKYRQKMSTDLDFLDAKPKPKSKPAVVQKGKKRVNRKAEAKRKFKNEKYGMGGKKRGMKKNTKESAMGISGYKRNSKGNSGGKNKQTPRPGKSKRVRQKASKKR